GFSHSHDCLLSWPGDSESRVPGTDLLTKVPETNKMRRKTRVLTPVFRQLSFSQLLSTVCRILPHCAHVADMIFFLSIFGILIRTDRKSTRLNSSHVSISYAVFCLKKKTNQI